MPNLLLRRTAGCPSQCETSVPPVAPRGAARPPGVRRTHGYVRCRYVHHLKGPQRGLIWGHVCVLRYGVMCVF